MLYQATHLTRYRYDQPVAQSLSEARLTPRSLPWQRVIESRIDLEPEPTVRQERLDYFGNEVTAFSVFQTHDLLTATASSVVEVLPRTFDSLPKIAWESARQHLADQPGR